MSLNMQTIDWHYILILYQINMAESYWADGIHERKAVFELFFRKLTFRKRICDFCRT